MNIEELDTTAEISEYVRRVCDPRLRRQLSDSGDALPQSLPLEVAEPGILIERAVEVAGSLGLTLQEVRTIFKPLGKERFDRGLRYARSAGRLTEVSEMRENATGRAQRQVVLHFTG